MPAHCAADIKHHLELLEQERLLALDAGLLVHPGYAAELEEEILAARHAFVGSAVIEIACLRAALSAPQVG